MRVGAARWIAGSLAFGVVVLAGGLSGAAARGDLGTAGAPGVGVVRGLAVANPAHVEVAPCRPAKSRKCQKECDELFSGVEVNRCIVRRTLNQNGQGRYFDTWDAIAWRESRYQADAISWTGCCYGIFQEHKAFWGWLWAHFGGTWDDPKTNTLAAIWIYEHNGWAPWGRTP